MARASSHYVCQSCGAASSKWSGKCEACGEWNSITEEALPTGPPKGLHAASGKGAASHAKARRVQFEGLDEETRKAPRFLTGIAEFDRVCGGGLVDGSALLIGGDPGIGKSTLLLQTVCRLSAAGISTAYISGEEAIDQIRLRADRLGVVKAPIALATATSVRDIVSALETDKPRLTVIDSIQTMYVDTLDSAPGTVAQVRASAQELIRVAKTNGITLLLVGHVTKDGAIAGPRVLEHMVDTVLYFEGDRGHQFRILRTVKNRFGATDEIGIFEMTDKGLSEVANPSALFLADRRGDVSGAAVFAGIEGTRPVLVEIQALVAPCPPGTPRRAVIGWDSARLAMVLAVLEARCGIQIGMHDIYLNVAGGLRISEPAADLAVAAALLSSLSGEAVPSDTIFFGEVGLSGEIRSVSQTDQRLKEAAKLGFVRAVLPESRTKKQGDHGLKLTAINHLDQLLPLFPAKKKKA
jgi:DNA repair protein RadA/Sms